MNGLFYDLVDSNVVRCNVCHHRCYLRDSELGICGVRQNNNGEIVALNYGMTIASNVDPIEKKPLHHFMPGTKTYSIATVGCNLHCKWCQNYQISQVDRKNATIPGVFIEPKKHVDYCIKHQIPSISYTYTEPTIFVEYALDIMCLAKEKGIRNIWVTNGYMTRGVLDAIIPYLDAVNVDYKGPNDSINKHYTSGSSEVVLNNIRYLYNKGVHVEITSLLVPGVNDTDDMICQMVEKIADISTSIPWHISRFFPAYQMTNVSKTPLERLHFAYQKAIEAGLQNVYLGNI